MKRPTKAIRPHANTDWCSCRTTSIAKKSNIMCSTFQLNLHHDADTAFEPARLLHFHSDQQPSVPTNAIQFGGVPNAYVDAIRQQRADRQQECVLPNLPQISGANIKTVLISVLVRIQRVTMSNCKHLPTPSSYSAASPQQQWHSLTELLCSNDIARYTQGTYSG